MSASFYDVAPLAPLVEAGFVVLTPNVRLARRISSEWDARQQGAGLQAWEPWPVQPLESWLLGQWERAVALGLAEPLLPLAQPQQLELWQQAIIRRQREADDYHLLRPAVAAELASQARESLIRWQVDTAEALTRQQFGFDTDCSTYLEWQALFEERLAAAGMCTPGDAVQALLACAAELPPARAVLVEFDDIPPLFRAALEALCEETREIRPAAPAAVRLAHGFADRRDELQAVAHWAATTSEQDPGATLGIVLSNMSADRTALEYLLRREFGCLGEDYNSLPVNFSTGIPLSRAPVVRDALAALALVRDQTTVPAVVALLGSRFLDLPDADSALANALITRLFDDGRRDIDVADLRYKACKIKLGEQEGLSLGRYLVTVSGMRQLREPAPPSVWVDRFCEVLDAWGWPGAGPLDSLEYQQVELWYRTLDEYTAYDAVCGPVDFTAALQLLESACDRRVSQPQTAESPVQVLGPLEAAGLAFDQLWLVGMEAGSWPAVPRPSPFIPMSLQRKRQMPHATAEREWAFSEGLLEQYTRSAGVLHASYCRELDDIPQLPSAFLEGFREQPLPSPPVLAGAWLQQWRERSLQVLDDECAPRPGAAELGAVAGGSGLLEDQSHCPFRAFARRRLQVEPLSGFSLALSPGDRGSLLHDALYTLWGSIGDHDTLTALDEQDESRLVEAAVQAAVQAVPGGLRRLLGGRYWQLESQRLSGLLGEWLDVERQRSRFVVLQREQEIDLKLGRLAVSLRVDRVDRLDDGSLVVIDYKSGISRIQDWLGDRPARPQLLLYGLAAPGPTTALAFAQLRPGDSRFVGLGCSAVAPGVQTDIPRVIGERMPAQDWDSLNACWRENLRRLAEEFLHGDAAVDPLAPASCTWCGLQPLCRVGLAEEAPQ